MAATRLIALHVNKGKSVAQCLADRTDYSQNAEKTNDGEFISSYECDAMTADEEFLLSKREYQHITGRAQRSDIIAYQIRQSFKPGEVTPEEANAIGYELAQRFTKGHHAFIVATHIDKAHIHNHIIYNSTSLDCTRKFKDFFYSGIALRRVSDRICLEHGLSIIEPKPYDKRKKRTEYPQRISARSEIQEAIDSVLREKTESWEALIKRLQEQGYEYKNGKHPALKGKGQRAFIRFRSMGEGYTEEEIRAVISGRVQPERRKPKDNRTHQEKKGINLLIDIQAKLLAGKGVGYERWAKVFNLKQASMTLLKLQENNIQSYAELVEKTDAITKKADELSARIKADEAKLAEIAVLKTHIINYAKTRAVYVEYRKAGYSSKFFEAHRTDIQLHKAAKEAFNQMNIQKLPTVKSLQEQYSQVLEEKKKLYGEYRPAREDMKEWQLVKANTERILNIERTEKETKERQEEQEKSKGR
ncbi:MAG: relaxase [Clostridia bacterium]|nr:relaxase [Clostridia bacterium]